MTSLAFDGTRTRPEALAEQLVDSTAALPGRGVAVLPHPGAHLVLNTPMAGPWPEGTHVLYTALGCFWGAEKMMWQLPGVVTTAVGYMGGYTPNPTYAEVCTDRTGHTETVMIAYNPDVISDLDVITTFWEAHDPTQGFRQGADVGSQYRSALYYTTESQREAIEATYASFGESLAKRGYGEVTTEVRPASEAGPFFYAEEEHQQYLEKNPGGYCPVHSTGVACGV